MVVKIFRLFACEEIILSMSVIASEQQACLSIILRICRPHYAHVVNAIILLSCLLMVLSDMSFFSSAGTGKTAMLSICALQLVDTSMREIQVLIMNPTRSVDERECL